MLWALARSCPFDVMEIKMKLARNRLIQATTAVVLLGAAVLAYAGCPLCW